MGFLKTSLHPPILRPATANKTNVGSYNFSELCTKSHQTAVDLPVSIIMNRCLRNSLWITVVRKTKTGDHLAEIAHNFDLLLGS